MLAVTEAARGCLAQMLDQQGVATEAAVRLVHEPDGVMLQSDVERAGDQTIRHEGRTVLLMDAKLSELLAQSTLDVDGLKLTLRHPKPNA